MNSVSSAAGEIVRVNLDGWNRDEAQANGESGFRKKCWPNPVDEGFARVVE